MVKGSCLCGRIAFEIHGAIVNARYCHCANCRKFSGAAYAPWGVVRADELKVTTPQSSVTRYDSGGGLRVFCGSCGSPVWYEPVSMPQLRGVPLGAFDERDIPAPEMHVWTQSKVPWATINDDLPQHETHP